MHCTSPGWLFSIYNHCEVRNMLTRGPCGPFSPASPFSPFIASPGSPWVKIYAPSYIYPVISLKRTENGLLKWSCSFSFQTSFTVLPFGQVFHDGPENKWDKIMVLLFLHIQPYLLQNGMKEILICFYLPWFLEDQVILEALEDLAMR